MTEAKSNTAIGEAIEKAYKGSSHDNFELFARQLSFTRFQRIWFGATMGLAVVGGYSLGGVLITSTSVPAILVPVVTGVFGVAIGMFMAVVASAVHSALYDYVAPTFNDTYNYVASWFASESEIELKA